MVPDEDSRLLQRQRAQLYDELARWLGLQCPYSQTQVRCEGVMEHSIDLIFMEKTDFHKCCFRISRLDVVWLMVNDQYQDLPYTIMTKIYAQKLKII